MFDLLIANATILDGDGSAPYMADIGIRGDTIADVGDLSAATAHHALDLDPSRGTRHPTPDTPHATAPCITAPGFIDVHSHSDAYLLIHPSADSKLFQGITTEIVGNCGASAAPRGERYKMPSDWRDKEFPGTWRTVAEYRRLLEQVQPAVNTVMLTGHNALRIAIMGYDRRHAAAEEVATMVRLLEQCLDEGSRGLSTGFLYPPGMHASSEEITQLARVVARHNGIYTSHMRSEGARLLEAIAETLDVGVQSGVRVQVSHLKASGHNNWGKLDDALALIRRARERGQAVAADRYPYTAGATDLDVVLPEWVAEGGPAAALERLRDPSTAARVGEEMRAERGEGEWAGVTIGSTFHPNNRPFQGLALPDAAKRLGLDPVGAILHFALTDELKTGAFFAGMSEDNMLRVLAEPYVMLGTDASLRAPYGPLSQDYPHPRAYGSFPKFLRMALDGQTVDLPEAVRKMTSLPADQFGLTGRGRIAKGAKADVVVFRPDAIRDTATYGEPHRLAEGVDHVIVNGVLEIADGKLTGDRGGRVL